MGSLHVFAEPSKNSTHNAIVRWHGPNGEEVANSKVLIDNSGSIATPGDITARKITAVNFDVVNLLNGLTATQLDSTTRANLIYIDFSAGHATLKTGILVSMKFTGTTGSADGLLSTAVYNGTNANPITQGSFSSGKIKADVSGTARTYGAVGSAGVNAVSPVSGGTYYFYGVRGVGSLDSNTHTGGTFYKYAIFGKEPPSSTGVTTETIWAGYFTGDVQLDSGKKLILEGSETSKGDSYLVFNSGASDLEIWVNGTKALALYQLGLRSPNIVTPTLSDSIDTTKLLDFSLSGATTGKKMTLASSHTDDRTLTLPNATDTLVGKATTDTLTNKTLTTPTIASMTNAQHDHADAAGGGTISTSAYRQEAHIDLVSQTTALVF